MKNEVRTGRKAEKISLTKINTNHCSFFVKVPQNKRIAVFHNSDTRLPLGDSTWRYLLITAFVIVLIKMITQSHIRPIRKDVISQYRKFESPDGGLP